MKSYRPLFGTIFIGLIAMLLGGGALLSAFGHNIFFAARFSLSWVVVGLLVVSALLLLAAAFWPRHENDSSGYSQSAHYGGNPGGGYPLDSQGLGGQNTGGQNEGVASLFDSRGSAPATVRSTEEFTRTASFGTPVTAVERRFVPVTDDDARKGASSEGGNVLADLRWLEPNGEQVSVPLYARAGSIDLLINADSAVAIRLAMGTGNVTVDPTLGLHRVGEEPLEGAVANRVAEGTQILLGRHMSDANEAHLIVNVESPSADLHISAM